MQSRDIESGVSERERREKLEANLQCFALFFIFGLFIIGVVVGAHSPLTCAVDLHGTTNNQETATNATPVTSSGPEYPILEEDYNV